MPTYLCPHCTEDEPRMTSWCGADPHGYRHTSRAMFLTLCSPGHNADPCITPGESGPHCPVLTNRVQPQPCWVGGSREVLAPLILAFQERRTGAGLDINPAVSTSCRPAPSCRISHPITQPGAALWGCGGHEGLAGKGSTEPKRRAEARAAASPPSPGAYLLGEGGGNVQTASACREGLLSGQNQLRWKTALQPQRKQRWRAG